MNRNIHMVQGLLSPENDTVRVFFGTLQTHVILLLSGYKEKHNTTPATDGLTSSNNIDNYFEFRA